MKKVIAVSGYFDPLHVGHIDYLEMASQLGDELVVIVNNDYQASLKKGKSFMKEDDRVRIIGSLKCVDRVVLSIDTDMTVCKSLQMVSPNVFANGGDRANHEIAEAKICRELSIETIDGLGNKIRSSSEYTGLKQVNDG